MEKRANDLDGYGDAGQSCTAKATALAAPPFGPFGGFEILNKKGAVLGHAWAYGRACCVHWKNDIKLNQTLVFHALSM